MQKFGRGVVKLRVPILIVSVLLLIPSIFGFVSTRINYDILSYLPSDIETMKGQDIMLDEFGKGGFSLVMLDGMEDKDVEKVKEKIEKVDHVCDVLWYDTLADVSLPKEVLPDDIYDFFNTDNSTMMAVFFDEATSADGSLEAVKEIRSIAGEQCFVSGMSSVVEDIKDLTMQEAPMYVVIAVILTSIILALTMDSFLIPLFFMLSVGMAIIYNMGTNFIQGEISFITEALAAVLQLAVTIDYSIFLWHSYKEEKEKHPGDNKEAMAVAIGYALKTPQLVLFSLIAVGAAANELGKAGGPLAVLVVAIVASECGKIVSKETKIDIIVTPAVTISIGVLLSLACAPAIGKAASSVGNAIMWATELQPFFMGILVSVLVGVALTLPISSAAICAALGLTGLAGGAAVAGCCAQMIGFAVMSFKENKWGGLFAQGLGTSMLQMGNIVRNPRIWLPPTLASAITGPLATCLFHLKMNGAAVASGMGTCGLVGQIGVYTGWVNDVAAGTKAGITAFDWIGMILICFILPAVLTLLIAVPFRKNGWIKENDLKLDL